MEMKVAVAAFQTDWMDKPEYSVFRHGVDEKSLTESFALIDPDAVVTFKEPSEAELIRGQIAALERERTRIDAEAGAKKARIEDRIAKLSALTWEKL